MEPVNIIASMAQIIGKPLLDTYGKKLWKKAVGINNVDEALSSCLCISFMITLKNAMEEVLKSECKIEDEWYEQKKEQYPNIVFSKFDKFHFEDKFLENNECQKLIQYLREEFIDNQQEISKNPINSKNWNNLILYVQDWWYINFIELIYKEEIKYNLLHQHIHSKSFDKIENLKNLKKYKNILRSYYEQVVMNNEKGLTLKDLYVEPRIGVFKESMEIGRRINKEFLYLNQKENQLFIPLKIKVHVYIHEFLKEIDICHIKKRTPKVLFLLGQPGQGKSSFCYRLLYDLLTNKPHKKPVFFVRLRYITNTPSLLESPLDTIFNHIEEVHQLNISKGDKKKCILILDGLDELQMIENFGVDKVDAFCTALIKASKGENMDVHIILTSRYYIGLEKFTKQDVLILNLQGFDKVEQKQWIDQYDTNSWLLKELGNIFIDGGLIPLSEFVDHLFELMEQPLLLYMLAQLQHPEIKHLTMANLYDKLFTELIERNYSDTGKLEIYKEKGIEVEDIREMVREIAYQIANTHKATFLPSQSLKKVKSVKNFLEKLYGNFEESKLEVSLRGVMMAFYFNEIQHNQHEESKTAIEFLHLSLQEYMTAEYLWEKVKKQFTRNTYRINTAEEALTFVFELFHTTQYKLEILDYLKEIIERDKSTDIKKIVFERLTIFLPDLLESDFLDSKILLESQNQNNPIEKAFNTFYYYWHILRWVKTDEEIIVPQNISKMVKLNTIYDRGFDFSNANLVRTNFSFCVLKFVNFYKANLQEANLESANLHKANLEGANLESASLHKANLEGANLQRANLVLVILTFANLEESYLGVANLEGAYLKGANLGGAYLKGANLEGANLEGANLESANLQDVILQDAILQETNLQRTELQGANLQGAELQGAELQGANLQGANLIDAKLYNANLFKTDFRDAILTDEQRIYARLERAILD
jgi:uncharacterized protein YjbI with pentapeptide repeats